MELFLNFTKGLKTQEIYSGMLYEVWLRVAIVASAEFGVSIMHYDYVYMHYRLYL